MKENYKDIKDKYEEHNIIIDALLYKLFNTRNVEEVDRINKILRMKINEMHEMLKDSLPKEIKIKDSDEYEELELISDIGRTVDIFKKENIKKRITLTNCSCKKCRDKEDLIARIDKILGQ